MIPGARSQDPSTLHTDPVTLRIAGVPEHFNLPWMLGLERRAFIRAGIDLQWRTAPGGTGEMCELLRNGEVDLAVLVTEGAVRDILNGNPGRIISNYVDSPLEWGVHVGAACPLRGTEDLKGVPFAISRFNSGSHLVAMSYAATRGWRPEEQDFVVVNDLKGAVERLRTDARLVFLWDATMTSPWVDQGALRKVDTYSPPWPCFVIVAREEAMERNAAAVHRALKVVRDQARGLMEKKHAHDIIAQRYGMSPIAAKAWFATVRWNLDGNVDMEALSTVCATLRELGMTAADTDCSSERLVASVR